LSPATAAALAALPRRADLPGGIVAAHGSPDDPCAYVEDVVRAEAELARLAPGTWVLLLGHVHRPFAVSAGAGRRATLPGRDLSLTHGTRHLLNPGAVGQARELRRRARCLVLDTGTRSARFFEPRYDADGARAALRRNGLPADALHRRPRLGRAALGELRRAAWRIGA
jgi:diadenosine tetraphosphatase ApaH/serine/threonine PP2A family protein phosphatase